jgi:hypothetical protein
MASAICHAESTSSEQKEPPFDVGKLLNGPDRKAFPWYVSVSGLTRTLEQRYSVQITATILNNSSKDKEGRRDLHFVLKAADANDRWIPGGFYANSAHAKPVDIISPMILFNLESELPPVTQSERQYTFRSCVYLRPGRYVLAIIVYDGDRKQENVARVMVKTPIPKKEPLPVLDRNLPDVEFIPFPQYVSTWLSDPPRWLPVNNGRYICIDILINISGGSPSNNILELSSVLSRLKLHNGCVHITIMDSLAMRLFYNREDAAGFNWQSARDFISKQDQDTVDARMLGSKTPYSFFHEKLDEILNDQTCAPGTEPPLKIVMVATRELKTPSYSSGRQSLPMRPDFTNFQYYYRGIDPNGNDSKMLASRLRKISKSWPREGLLYPDNAVSFRKVLASLISSIENLK